MQIATIKSLWHQLMRKNPRAAGFLDGTTSGEIYGWARDTYRPGTPVTVRLFHQGKEIGKIKANQFREDLRRLGVGDGKGRYGFAFPIPNSIRFEGEYTISAFANGVELENSPLLITEDGSRPFRRDGVYIRDWLAEQYLKGSGYELGALFRPVRMPTGVQVRYVDHAPDKTLQQIYREETQGHKLVRVDIVADGTTLAAVPDGSGDFFLAHGVLEHLENPLLALRNMFRVLRPGGVLMLSLPDKRHTFDIDRPVTPFEHLLRDYEEGPDWSREAHYREWTELVEKVKGEQEIRERLAFFQNSRYAIHFHVWSPFEMLEMFDRARSVVPCRYDLECFKANGDEGIFVLRKL